jgi:1,4-dihydroxy-2-naphthoyl-CoA hydrolase
MPDLEESPRPTIGEMLRQMGMRWVALDADHAITEMPYSEIATVASGAYFGGALLAMADPTANVLCIHAVNPTDAPDGPTSVTAQVNAHFVRNATAGKVRAEARWVHKGKRTMVVATTIYDEEGRLLLYMTSTHTVRGASPEA